MGRGCDRVHRRSLSHMISHPSRQFGRPAPKPLAAFSDLGMIYVASGPEAAGTGKETTMRGRHTLLLKTAGLLLALTTIAAAQDYPTKPVRLIIPFPPGGSNDVVGRLFATHLSEKLGKQVIADNRGAGAGGVVGTEVAHNAPPDGYTILIISLAHAVNPWLYKLPYDPIKGFTPIAMLGSGPNVLVVNPTLPANSVKELVEMAKQTPGRLDRKSVV